MQPTATGYRGVFPTTNKRLPFRAATHIDGKPVELGRFETVEEAARVYLAHYTEYMGKLREAAASTPRMSLEQVTYFLLATSCLLTSYPTFLFA